MENQIELPYNFIHGYTGNAATSAEGCNLLASTDFTTSANSFMPQWCSFPASIDHHYSSLNNAVFPQASNSVDAFSVPTSINSLHFPYNGGLVLEHNHVPISNSLNGLMVDHQRFSQQVDAAQGSVVSTLFGTIHAEIGKMTAQEMMDAKALAASKSHSEAERRRRERINGHFARLRSMLPNTTKTDKASLLAEVIQHVKELKRQTSEIAEENPLPSEADELTVNPTCDEDGNLIIRATLCCEDRTDLLPDLIKALKALKLRTVKAEITTVGGRVRNVLLISSETCDKVEQQSTISAISDSLKAVVEQTSKHDQSSSSSAGGSKRQRTNSLSSLGVIEQRSI